MTRPIRVLLADDHELFRAGIRALLQTLDGIEIVAEASNGREVLQLCKAHHVDVILMDIMMPQLNGLEATARLPAISPQTRTIILSMNANEEYVLQALRCGAAGYLLKNISPSELEQAVRAVARGDTYLSAAISKHVITAYLQRAGGEKISHFDRLTPRQREVLQLVAEGYTSKEIARKLSLSVKTVEMHRSQLMAALDIHDIAGLVRYAIRMRLIDQSIPGQSAAD
jgi:DNA-binding NarL/FixJ family response regulator